MDARASGYEPEPNPFPVVRVTPAHFVTFVGSGLGAFALMLWAKVRIPRHLKEKK